MNNKVTNALIALLLIGGLGLYLKKKALQNDISESAQATSQTGTTPPSNDPNLETAEPKLLPPPSETTVSNPTVAAPVPQPKISPDVASTMKKMELDNANGPKPFKQEDLPPEVQKMVAETQQRLANELATESSARQAIDEIAACLKSAPAGMEGMPPEMRQQMGQLANVMRTECERRGKNLVEKYPSLKSEYQSKVQSKN